MLGEYDALTKGDREVIAAHIDELQSSRSPSR